MSNGLYNTYELIPRKIKILQVDTISQCIGNISCQKKDLEKKRVKVSNEYYKTFEFVVIEIKPLQINTVSKAFWNLPCQKKDLEKKEGKSVEWVRQIPESLFL